MKSKVLLTTGLVFIAMLVVSQSPAERLQQLVGKWVAKESTFDDPPQGESTVIAAADGKAIYSTLTFGSGDTYYEANALWGYSETDKQVRVFEVNTIGVAATHIGNFDDSGELILELHDPDTNELLEYRAMSWTEDTWKMTARFIVNGEEISHHYTLTRVKE